MIVRRSFEPSEASVGAARRFVAGTITDVAVGVSESVAVMVSELSTNALVHATGGFEVIVDRSDHHVLVSVRDQGDGTPELQSPDASEPHGRGLRIVDALSEQWGISSTADAGKSVWFRMSLESPATGTPTEGTTRVSAGRTSAGTGPGQARPTTSPGAPGSAASGTPASQHRPSRHRRRVRPSTSVAPRVASAPTSRAR
jgi:anti-sigma regulatory factor (Ser/Thr protein kinase)